MLEVVLCATDVARVPGWRAPASSGLSPPPVALRQEHSQPVQPEPVGDHDQRPAASAADCATEGFHYFGWEQGEGGELVYVLERGQEGSCGLAAAAEEELCALMCHGNSLSMVLADAPSPQAADGAGIVCSYVRHVSRDGASAWLEASERPVQDALKISRQNGVERREERVRVDFCMKYAVRVADDGAEDQVSFTTTEEEAAGSEAEAASERSASDWEDAPARITSLRPRSDGCFEVLLND